MRCERRSDITQVSRSLASALTQPRRSSSRLSLARGLVSCARDENNRLISSAALALAQDGAGCLRRLDLIAAQRARASVEDLPFVPRAAIALVIAHSFLNADDLGRILVPNVRANKS